MPQLEHACKPGHTIHKLMKRACVEMPQHHLDDIRRLKIQEYLLANQIMTGNRQLVFSNTQTRKLNEPEKNMDERRNTTGFEI